MIEFKNVDVKFENYFALKDVTFKVNKNDFLNIVGPNGAGKTTLIQAIIDKVKVSNGEIIKNFDQIGYMQQKLIINASFPMTVKEFIYTGFIKQKLIISKEDIELMKLWMNRMDLDIHMLDIRVNKLSGGELQRVYFIRSLIKNPELIILDEPTSALDPEFRKKFYEILYELNHKGTTIIHVTHDIDNNYLKDDSKILLLDQSIKFLGDFKTYKKEYGHGLHAHS